MPFMPSVPQDLNEMRQAIDNAKAKGVRLGFAEAVANIKAICDTRPLLPDGEDDYLQIRKHLDRPLPADDDEIEARYREFEEEISLILLCRDAEKGQI